MASWEYVCTYCNKGINELGLGTILLRKRIAIVRQSAPDIAMAIETMKYKRTSNRSKTMCKITRLQIFMGEISGVSRHI